MNEDQFNQYYELLKNTFDKRYEFDQLSIPIFSQEGLKIQVHSAAISRNKELIVCGCCKGTIIVYDLISKSSYFALNTTSLKYRKHQIITVTFAHCYDYILAANSQGDLLIYKVEINIIQNCYEIDLIKYYSSFHDKPIHTIQHSSVDKLLLISQRMLHVYNLSDLLIDKEINKSKPIQAPQLEVKLNNVIITKIVIMKTHYYLYFGYRDGEIYKVRLGELTRNPKNKLLYTLNKQALIVCLEVSQDRTLMAIAYQLKGQTGYDELESQLTIRYLKKNKTIYTQSSISKNKISQLIFFNDNTHLMIGSWDSTFQILNIKQKQILTQYTIQLHPLGIISLFPIQEVPNFPTIISVGQDNVIKKTFFGNVKQSLFEFIPYICWVELRISQELTFQSALKRYLKILCLESMGVDHFKQIELQSCLFGYQLFNPLLKRIIDYSEYRSRSPILFNIRYPTESISPKKRRLPPIQNLIKQESIQQSQIEDKKIEADQNLFKQYQFYLYKKIMNNIDQTKVTMLVLQKCPYIFDIELGLYQDFVKCLIQFKNVRYIDISYNNLETNLIVNLLEQFKGVKLDFLNLAHNNIGSEELQPSQVITLLEGFASVSIRANNLSDIDGETILNQLNNFTSLKILDLSGNLNFGDQTLQALQRITLLSKSMQFARKKGDKEEFIKHLTFMEDKDLYDEENEIEVLKNQFDNQFPQSIKHDQVQSNQEINEDSKLIINQVQVDKKTGSQSFERQSSSSSSTNYVSLELLCLQFRPERCEEAMKTATDFLVQRTPTNFYIYVVDNKIDNVWESSISVFYTRNLKKINDYIKGCIIGIGLAFYNCAVSIYKTMYNEGYYCFKRIFCSSFFVYKYMLCIFCTLMTTQFGKVLQNVFGVQNSYYQFNPKSIQLELFLYNWRQLLFFLFAIYFLSFYFVIVFLPIIYVNDCQQSDWNGHLLYLTFATYSFFFEGIFGYKISSLKVTSNEYTDGNIFYRMFFIIKDLIISQLTKFQLYANICFIMVIYSCNVDVFLSWIGVSIIGINLIFDLALLIRYILIPYLYKLNLTYVDVFVQFSTLYQMNIVSNLLEIWSKQNRFPFPILKDAPQKVVVSMIKAFFLDIPLLLIQIIYLALHQEKTSIGILMVSLISSIIHGIFANISMLSITRAAQINQEIIMNEYSFHITNKIPPKNKPLRYYFRKVGNTYKQIVELFKFKNQNIYNNLRDSEEAIINMPHNFKQVSSNKVAQIQPIKQARKGVTVLGNKQVRQKISKKKIKESQPYLKKSQAKAVLELFGSKISTWKLKTVISIDIINVLLVDVPRENLQLGLDWDSTEIIENNIQITSLQKQIESFNQAYITFTHIINNQKFDLTSRQSQSLEITILDIGFGSGYSSLVFAALAVKFFNKIEIHLIDHIQETKLQFEQLLENKFKWIQEACQFKFFIQDCLFDIQLPIQYDFINIGAGTTRQRIENIKKQYLKPNGVLFGFEIFSPIESNGIVFREDKYNQLESMQHEEIQLIMPLDIQCDLIKNKQNEMSLQNVIQKIHDEFTQCCICSKNISPIDKCFINHFWGEVLCFECGMDNYLSQSKETDIIKLQYRCNVIYYPGQRCNFNTIKNELLLINTSYRSNVKVNKNRHHQFQCYNCSRDESKTIIGFRYLCLHDNLSFCNNCGRKILNQEINVPQPCQQDHMLLRIIFT